MPIGLSVSEAIVTLRPLLLFLIGMVIYTIFIFKFYLFIAKRDIIDFNLVQYGESVNEGWLRYAARLFLYFLEYIVLFPIFISVWFAVFV